MEAWRAICENNAGGSLSAGNGAADQVFWRLKPAIIHAIVIPKIQNTKPGNRPHKIELLIAYATVLSHEIEYDWSYVPIGGLISTVEEMHPL